MIVTLKVYVPVVVPGFVGPVLPLLLPPQLTPAVTTTTSRIASGTSFHLRSFGTLKRMKKQTTERAAPVSGQSRRDGRLAGGPNSALEAVVVQVIVAVPVSDDVVSVIVPGAVKLESGAPKLQLGLSVAPDGPPLIWLVRVTVPVNEFASVTVNRHEPDPPGAEIVIVAEQLVDVLTPADPTCTFTPVEVELA